MSWGAYAILIIFAAFVILLILNPNMSCFGKRIRSPFYPLRRKREMQKGPGDALKRKMTDYKFDLGEPAGTRAPGKAEPEKKAADKKTTDKKTNDYGFRLD